MKMLMCEVITGLVMWSAASAQFIDTFDGNKIVADTTGIKGWSWFTGDGHAVMDFSATGRGYASILVDARDDKRGIWWALIKRCVSRGMDLRKLSESNHELRVEARIRISDAPKRVNMSFNTNRTIDFHSNLIEFDIPDTTTWHTISMTTNGFDTTPGDTVYGQLALMDWGLRRYRVDVDYFRVDIVDPDTCGPDNGVQVRYHPPVPDVSGFAFHVPVAEDAGIDFDFPDLPMSGWSASDDGLVTRVLTVSNGRYVIFRWDLSRFAGKCVNGPGVLEFTTYSLTRSTDYPKDFGMIRVSEIVGGDRSWSDSTVTYDSFTRGEPIDAVINSQMIIDQEVAPARGAKNLIVIPRPVLQRMIDGRTPGIALKPLGAVMASFYDRSVLIGTAGSVLHFNAGPDSSSAVLK